MPCPRLLTVYFLLFSKPTWAGKDDCEDMHLCNITNSSETRQFVLKHGCKAKPRGIDSLRTECIKFFGFKAKYPFMKTHTERIKYCAKFSAKLAVPRTCQEMRFIGTIKPKVPGSRCASAAQYFLGTVSDDEDLSFRWSDGVHITSSRWGSMWHEGEPKNSDGQQNCVAHYLNQIEAIPCESNISQICEICIPLSELNATLNNSYKLCFNYTAQKIMPLSFKGCTGENFLFDRPDYEGNDEYPLSAFCDLLPCPSYRYGPDCKHQCFCKDFEACHLKTGLCPSGECENGWQGDVCNQNGCPLGRWGEKCDMFCACKDNQSCHRHTGLCVLGCVEGAGGTSCNSSLKLCEPRRYGENCEKTCHCLGVCTKKNGVCVSGCSKDWYGPYCNITECPLGLWGLQCERTCVCKNRQACDVNTGSCREGCAADWTGAACGNGPPGVSAPRVPGTGGYPGAPESETNDCPNGMWGTDCIFPCKNVNCFVCSNAAPFKGTRCDTCKPYHFFNEGLCDKQCTGQHYYGLTCNETCSPHCAGRMLCDKETGECLDGCEKGNIYIDEFRCIMEGEEHRRVDQEEETDAGDEFPWMFVGAVGLVALAVALVVAAGMTPRNHGMADQALDLDPTPADVGPQKEPRAGQLDTHFLDALERLEARFGPIRNESSEGFEPVSETGRPIEMTTIKLAKQQGPGDEEDSPQPEEAEKEEEDDAEAGAQNVPPKAGGFCMII